MNGSPTQVLPVVPRLRGQLHLVACGISLVGLAWLVVLADGSRALAAAWIYGVIAARLSRDVDGALRQLDRARNSQPENPDVAAALASLHFLRNDREAMLARLRDTLRYSRSGDQRRWAARQIASGNPDLTPSMK